jgi:hypothetical protein
MENKDPRWVSLQDKAFVSHRAAHPAHLITCSSVQDLLQDWEAAIPIFLGYSLCGFTACKIAAPSRALPGWMAFKTHWHWTYSQSANKRNEWGCSSCTHTHTHTHTQIQQGQRTFKLKDTTFLQLGPDFSYDILHQKCPTLPITPYVFLS